MGALGGLYSLLFVGFDFGTYLEYNFLYPDIYQNPEKYSGTPVELALNATAQRWFTLALLPSLQTPWISISLGVCLKTINFVAAFYFFSKVAELRRDWVFFGALILSSFSLFSDLSGEVEFTRGALAFTGIFLGVVLVLSGKVTLGYLCCAVAILIHPLDALSAFAFLIAGMLAATRKPREWGRHLRGMTPVLLAVGWVALEAPSADGVPRLAISEWYQQILTLEGDDVTLFWHIRENWFVVSIILIVGLISIIPRPRSRIEKVFIGMIALLGLVLLLELLHFRGFSFGFVSEKFIAIQFRRGLWLLLLVAVAVVAKCSERQEMTPRDANLLAGGLVALLIFPKGVFAVGLGAIAVIYLIASKGRDKLFIAMLGIGWMVTSVIWREKLGVAIYLENRQLLFLLLGLIVVLGWLFLVERVGPRKTFAAIAAVFISLKVGNNIVVEQSPVLRGEVDRVVQAAQLRTPSQVLDWLLSRSETPAAMLESSALASLPKASAALVAPVHSGYTAPIRASGSVFFSRWDGLIIYSRSAAESYLRKRDLLTNGANPCPKTIGSSAACVLDFLSNKIDSMTGQEISAYSKEFGLDHVIRRKELVGEEFRLVYRNPEYFVYQFVQSDNI